MSNDSSSFRRPMAVITPFSTSHLHLRNPWVVAFFAFSYPGFGNLMQQRYAKAFTLILWELFINHLAHVNLAIMHSLLGHFEQAKDVLNERWFILYVAIYMYAIWDTYRTTLDLNKIYVLASRENAPIQPMKASIWDLNYLDKRNPVMALLWSVFLPGLGHLYVHKVITGIFMLFYTVVVVYMSRLPVALHYMLIGQFEQSTSMLDMQWFMFIPSIYWFIVYDSYVSAVELNKLFEIAQTQYLKKEYQPANFKMPL